MNEEWKEHFSVAVSSPFLSGERFLKPPERMCVVIPPQRRELYSCSPPFPQCLVPPLLWPLRHCFVTWVHVAPLPVEGEQPRADPVPPLSFGSSARYVVVCKHRHFRNARRTHAHFTEAFSSVGAPSIVFFPQLPSVCRAGNGPLPRCMDSEQKQTCCWWGGTGKGSGAGS